jgi:signal transduction histidine kinase
MSERGSDASSSDAILEFLRRAGTERSTARLVGEMFRFIATSFEVYRVSLFLAQAPGGRMRPFVSELATGVGNPELFEEWRRLDVEQFEVVQRIRAGEDLIVIEDPTDHNIPTDIVTRYGLQPYLAIALRQDGEPLGVLLVEGSIDTLRVRHREITEFSQYLAMALANASAFEREQQRTRDAQALLEVGEALTHTTDLIPVLASVAQNCARVTDFDRCSVFLLDDDTGRLVPTMSQYADGHADSDLWERFTRAEIDLPAAYEVLRTGRPLAFDDASADPHMNPPWWVDPFGIKSILYLPLAAWGERFGVVALDRSRFHEIEEHQIRVAQAVASQGAVAIQLSRSLDRERSTAARLRELDELKNTFVAAISHELRTPLTTIIGFSSILEPHVDDEGAEFLTLIQRESVHLESLISNLLLTSNIEAGALELRDAPIDLAEVIDEAVDLLRRLHPERDFRVEVAGPLPMRGDDARLRQVLTNLLQNAVKYSPEEGSITVIAGLSDDGIELEVVDRGPGIPHRHRETVFERFRRGDDHSVQGTGIGLYLVRELVEGHAGSVRVEDGPGGVGARFVIELPSSVTAANAA